MLYATALLTNHMMMVFFALEFVSNGPISKVATPHDSRFFERTERTIDRHEIALSAFDAISNFLERERTVIALQNLQKN